MFPTVDKQLLEQMVRQAVAACGFAALESRCVSQRHNVIYRVATAVGPLAVRIYTERERSNTDIEAELVWLEALATDSELLLPVPHRALSGEWVQELPAGVDDRRLQVVVLSWVPGEIVGDGLRAADAREIGQLMARLHTQAVGFELPGGVEREEDWHGMRDLLATQYPGQVARLQAMLSAEELALCRAAAAKVAREIDQIERGANFGLTHSDLHAENVVRRNGRLGIFDFEDCQPAPFTNDLAITLSSFDGHPEEAALADGLLASYTALRSLPASAAAEIAAFRVERRLRLIRWVATWPEGRDSAGGQRLVAQSVAACRAYLDG